MCSLPAIVSLLSKSLDRCSRLFDICVLYSKFGLGVSVPASTSAGLGSSSCQWRASKTQTDHRVPSFRSGPEKMEVCCLEVLLQYMKRDINKLISYYYIIIHYTGTCFSYTGQVTWDVTWGSRWRIRVVLSAQRTSLRPHQDERVG